MFSLEVIQEWMKIVVAWDEDHDAKPDPYEEPSSSVSYISLDDPYVHNNAIAHSMSSLWLQLVQEDAIEAKHGKVAPHEVMASMFLQLGIELEDQM